MNISELISVLKGTRELIKNLHIDSLLVFMIALHQPIYISYIQKIRCERQIILLMSFFHLELKTEHDFPSLGMEGIDILTQ